MTETIVPITCLVDLINTHYSANCLGVVERHLPHDGPPMVFIGSYSRVSYAHYTEITKYFKHLEDP